MVSFDTHVTSGTPLLKEPRQAGPLKHPFEAGGRTVCPFPAAKFPAFYRARRFITLLTTARHFSPPSVRLNTVQDTPQAYRFFNIRFNIILLFTSKSSICLPNSGFPTKTLHPSLLPPACHMHRPSLPLLNHPSMRRGVQLMKLLFTQFPLSPVISILSEINTFLSTLPLTTPRQLHFNIIPLNNRSHAQ